VNCRLQVVAIICKQNSHYIKFTTKDKKLKKIGFLANKLLKTVFVYMPFLLFRYSLTKIECCSLTQNRISE